MQGGGAHDAQGFSKKWCTHNLAPSRRARMRYIPKRHTLVLQDFKSIFFLFRNSIRLKGNMTPPHKKKKLKFFWPCTKLAFKEISFFYGGNQYKAE